MCDKVETTGGGLGWRSLNEQERAEVRSLNERDEARSKTGKSSKADVMALLHGAARDLEMQAAGVRRLADIVNMAGEHDPLFAALAAVVRK